MTLQLSKISHEMEALGIALEHETSRLEQALPDAQEALRRIGLVADLESRIQRAIGLHWAGAIPLHEPVSDTIDIPPHPSRANIIATDGSQIYPDRHGVALYYLINIGSILFPHGISQPPTCNSQPQVFFETSDLYDGTNTVGSTTIDTRRSIAEVGELARLAAEVVDTAPTLALIDNGLILYGEPHSRNQHEHDAAVIDYLERLDYLQSSGAALAGIIDRPRSNQVLSLVHLSCLCPDEITSESLHYLDKFERISDAMLFSNLAPGERSALFMNASSENLHKYQPRGHKMCFFYVNAGQPGWTSLLRVEIPVWVAQDVDKLQLVHAGVLEQCRATGGFPYVLMRAHELAVVSTYERRQVDNMVAQTMIKRGLSPMVSRKAQGKLWVSHVKNRW